MMPQRVLDTGTLLMQGAGYLNPAEMGMPDTSVDELRDSFVDNYDLNKGGVKFDAGKPAFDLLAPEFLVGTAKVLEYGAKKYAPRNWEAGMRWGRPFGAMMRHMWAWWGGERDDPETGISHPYHAACMLMFLAAYEARQIGEDDRKRSFDDA